MNHHPRSPPKVTQRADNAPPEPKKIEQELMAFTVKPSWAEIYLSVLRTTTLAISTIAAAALFAATFDKMAGFLWALAMLLLFQHEPRSAADHLLELVTSLRSFLDKRNRRM